MDIIFTVASMAGGGAERVISILANRLAKKGNRITVVMIAGEKVDYQMEPQIRMISLGGTTGGSMWKRFERIRKLRILFRQDQEAVIISFGLGSNFYTAAAHMGLKNPLVISERNDPAACPHPHFRNHIFRCADRLVFQTEDALQCFPKKLKARGIVIPNPVTKGIAAPYEGKRKETVVAVGRLEPQKNYPLMLQAFADFQKDYPDYTLHLFGRGFLLEELQKMAQNLGIAKSVVFEGFAENVHDRIRDAGMYVLSSDYEGISNALLEAMALGLPVISTDCPIGGSRLCIETEKNGLLVPVKDAGRLAKAMRRLASDREFAAELGREAAKIRSRFSEEAITEMWEKALDL